MPVDTEGESSFESLLDSFDIQGEVRLWNKDQCCFTVRYPTVQILAKQAVKQFEKDAKLLMNCLPLKSSIPKAREGHCTSFNHTCTLLFTGSTKDGSFGVQS